MELDRLEGEARGSGPRFDPDHDARSAARADRRAGQGDHGVSPIPAPLSPLLVNGELAVNAAALRGREVFLARKCAACHAPPEYTSPERFDVGLSDEVGNRRFNPPSLRGVSRREPLLHDGRASTLEDLFRRDRHPRDSVLSTQEIGDLVAFLRTL